MLDELDGYPTFYEAEDTGDARKLHGLLVPPELHLKVGAKVMLLRNLDVGAKLVNGAQGTEVNFTGEQPGFNCSR